jgi:hypothetical protein
MAEYPLRQRLMDQVVQDLKNWKPEELQWPTDDELLQLAREWNSGNESIDFDCIADYTPAKSSPAMADPLASLLRIDCAPFRSYPDY